MVLGTKIDSVNVLYGACGDAEEIYRRDDYSDIADLNPRAAKALLSKELENASAVVAQCDRKGVGILTYDDPLFPRRWLLRLRCSITKALCAGLTTSALSAWWVRVA